MRNFPTSLMEENGNEVYGSITLCFPFCLRVGVMSESNYFSAFSQKANLKKKNFYAWCYSFISQEL